MDSPIRSMECRVCLSQQLLINIFTNKAHKIVEKLCFCASVQISENDGLPQHICTKCFADLEIAYAFRKRCEENDFKFRLSMNVPVKVEILEDFESKNEFNCPSDDKVFASQCAVTEPDETLDDFEGKSEALEPSDPDYDESSDEATVPPHESNGKATKTYTCETCGENFTAIKDYYAHIREHGAKRFQCKTCSKWFSRRPSLIAHELRHQGKQERVPCDQCSLDFNNVSALRRHIAGIHENRRDFVCKICGYGFAQKKGLDAHKSVHSGAQFKCSKCEATFKSLRFFLRHEQNHLPPEERNPKLMFTQTTYQTKKRIYVCSFCGKTSNNYNVHQVHERFHTGERPYSCKTCGKAFHHSSTLRKHMLIHTGERSYKCEICGKCFRLKAHLTTHNLTHTQERNHVCQICSKAFTLKCTLKSHMKCHAVCEESESVE